MEIRDAFEDVIKGNTSPQSESKKEPAAAAHPQEVPAVISAGPQTAPDKEAATLGQKAADLFSKLTSKVGSLLSPGSEEAQKESPSDSPSKRQKSLMFSIDEESASLKPKETSSPSMKKLVKGESVGKRLSAHLINCRKEMMFSFFSKVNLHSH